MAARKPRAKSGRMQVRSPLTPKTEVGTAHVSAVGQVFINCQRRVGLVTADCAAWTRMLRIDDHCLIDIVRMSPTTLEHEEWKPLAGDDQGFCKFKLANTLAQSQLTKTKEAARVIQEIQMQANYDGMSMQQLTDEYNRITGKTVKGFSKKADAIKALQKATQVVNVEAPKADTTQAAPTAVPTATTKENDLAAKKKAGKSAKATATKKAAKTAAKVNKASAAKAKARPTTTKAKAKARPTTDKPKKVGIGALIRELISKGKGNEEIVDTVLQKFPDAKTNAANVSWYRNDMKKAKK